MNTIPTFAVAGEPNVGKSTLVATLSENDQVKIDFRAGTTKKATHYTTESDGQPLMHFIDLPGFENTAYIMEWFESHKMHVDNLAEAFVGEHTGMREYALDCEILRSFRDTAVLFVVDASIPVEEEHRYQSEILRLCSDKRLAIINVHSDEPQDETYLKQWEDLLARNFTYVMFDPHAADFEDRVDLLAKIALVMPRWGEPMQRVVGILKDEWERRLEDIAALMCELLVDVISIERSSNTRQREKLNEEKMRAAIQKDVSGKESSFRQQVRTIFKHKTPNWILEEKSILNGDIFSEEVWELFGLGKMALVGTAIVSGAIIGGGLDLVTGGLSFGLGTALGGAAGLSVGLAAASMQNAIEIPVPGLWGKLSFSPVSDCKARVSVQSNLIWILIDRAFLYTRSASRWSHGKTGKGDAEATLENEKVGYTHTWSKAEREAVSQWLAYQRKGDEYNTRKYRLEVAEQILRGVKKIVSKPV